MIPIAAEGLFLVGYFILTWVSCKIFMIYLCRTFYVAKGIKFWPFFQVSDELMPKYGVTYCIVPVASWNYQNAHFTS